MNTTFEAIINAVKILTTDKTNKPYSIKTIRNNIANCKKIITYLLRFHKIIEEAREANYELSFYNEYNVVELLDNNFDEFVRYMDTTITNIHTRNDMNKAVAVINRVCDTTFNINWKDSANILKKHYKEKYDDEIKSWIHYVNILRNADPNDCENYLLLLMYMVIPPVRDDYKELVYFKTFKDFEDDENVLIGDNIIIVDECYILLSNYKNYTTQGVLKIPVPNIVIKYIYYYIKATNGERLFKTNPTLNHYGINGCNELRHAFVSYIYHDDNPYCKNPLISVEIDRIMNHTRATAIDVYFHKTQQPVFYSCVPYWNIVDIITQIMSNHPNERLDEKWKKEKPVVKPVEKPKIKITMKKPIEPVEKPKIKITLKKQN